MFSWFSMPYPLRVEECLEKCAEKGCSQDQERSCLEGQEKIDRVQKQLTQQEKEKERLADALLIVGGTALATNIVSDSLQKNGTTVTTNEVAQKKIPSGTAPSSSGKQATRHKISKLKGRR